MDISVEQAAIAAGEAALGADAARPAEDGPVTDVAPHFAPSDASVTPRYAGVRTFARLPHVQLPHEQVDAAVLGVPFDTATSFRPGARFGPEAIRSASARGDARPALRAAPTSTSRARWALT
jgi:hypothetical protein